MLNMDPGGPFPSYPPYSYKPHVPSKLVVPSKRQRTPHNVPYWLIFYAETIGAAISICMQTASSALFPTVTGVQSILIGLLQGFIFFVVGTASGQFSMGHSMPFLSMAFYALGVVKDPWEVIITIGGDFAGAFLGTLITFAIFGTTSTLGTPQVNPAFHWRHGIAIETFGTFAIIFLALFVLRDRKWTLTGAFSFGTIVGVANMIGNDISGGCFNWPRHLAPAVISVTWNSYAWIYYVGPLAGAIFAYFAYLPFKGHHERLDRRIP